MATILRYRGDTVPDKIIVKNPDGSVKDVTSCSFLLTVNRERGPSNTNGQLFQIVGVITDAAGGKVSFTPSPDQANQEPGKYFYDIQMTDAGGAVQTLIVSSYIVRQDITK